MNDFDVIWTVIPRRVADNRLYATLEVSPRVRKEEAFEQFFSTWPARLATFRFELVCTDGTTTYRATATPQLELVPEMWSTFFATDTDVSPWRNRSGDARIVLSNRAGKASEFLQESEGRAFNQYVAEENRIFDDGVPIAPPALERLRFWRKSNEPNEPMPMFSQTADVYAATEALLAQALGTSAINRQTPLRIARVLMQRLSARPHLDLREDTLALVGAAAKLAVGDEIPDRDVPYAAMLNITAFHSAQRPPAAAREARARAITSAQAETRSFYDFHERIALLKSYPALVAPLGLIVRLSAPIEPGTNEPPAHGVVTAVVTGDGHHQSPKTHYVYSPKGRFAPRAAMPGVLQSGHLNLADHQTFCLTDRDVDGHAIKTVAAANDDESNVTRDTETLAGSLPSSRSSGISLMHCHRDRAVANALTKASAASADDVTNVEVFADQLVRGYSVVVKDKEGHKGSLVRRKEVIWFGPDPQHLQRYPKPTKADPEPFFERDAGIKPSGVIMDDYVAQADPTLKQMQVGESIFSWDGWSLTAPSTLAKPLTEESSEPPPNKEFPFELKCEYTAKDKSLVPLRINSSYQFSMPALDIAGDRIASDSDSAAPVSAEQHYTRYEPIPAPIVMLDRSIDVARIPGESVRTMVLPPPGGGLRSQSCDRWLVPPMTTFRMAEQHGMYDGKDKSPREMGGFEELQLEYDEEHCRWLLPEDPGGNPIAHQTEGLKLRPYLPDPMACVVRFDVTDLVRNETGAIEHHFYGPDRQWPKARRLLFRLQGRDGNRARMAFARRTRPDAIVIALPPAWVVRVRISCGPCPSYDGSNGETKMRELSEAAPKVQLPAHEELRVDALGPFASWQALRKRIQGQVAYDVDTAHAVALGAHPMTSPPVTLLLVHPVPSPLHAPRVDDAAVLRERGQTEARIDARLLVDRKSTGRVEVAGEWTDSVDDVRECEPRTSMRRTTLVRRNDSASTENQSDSQIPIPAPDDPSAQDFDPDRLSTIEAPLLHAFPDTAAHVVDYSASGVSRFERYYPARTIKALASQKSLSVRVPSTARPALPSVRYIIPAFEWSENEEKISIDPRHRFEVRRHAALRVWLNRPWFSSGNGELLGVVLYPPLSDTEAAALNERKPVSLTPARTVPAEVEPYVTRWGRNNIYRGADLPPLPTAHHFVNATHFGTGLLLGEMEKLRQDNRVDVRVSVAGYEPHFDKNANGWYCDIDIRPVPSYFAFVRLALVRYQPLSISGVELSPVVVADFAQLAPDRTVTVMRYPESKDTLIVEVFGTPNAERPRQNTNKFTVRVARSCNDRCGDDDGEMSWIDLLEGDDYDVVSRLGSSESLWSALIRFKNWQQKRRIVLVENERLEKDSAEDMNIGEMAERTVYAAVITM